ncbi:uncharacterized protein LOC111411547 [Olea europaea var. sylvestris]|uniref:uncharacterized protein LOC111411547 n=1 Tax=Olea europaea var. sylvestris TaxID=158386 RepID=UPI000C1CE2C3|nr:uncharacterized protein LOC111411547 [Olea europaea var. sylvestris]
MVGGRGRGRRGQVSIEEVPHRDRNIQDVTIEDLQRQVAELTQCLAEQEFGNHDVEGLDFDTSFENPYHHRARVWEHRGREDHNVDLSFRVDLPEFSVEQIFEYKEVPDCVKVKLVATKLKGRASAWWEQLKRSRERQGKSKITNWEKMKKKMKGHFLPLDYTQTLFQRLHSLRQGARSVNDYTEEFYQLVARNDLSETEEQIVARYLGRLRQPLQDVLSLHSLWTVSEAYQRALTIAKQQSRPVVGGEGSQPVHPQESRPVYQPQKPIGQKNKNLLIEEDMIEDFKEVGKPVYDEGEDEDVLYGDGQETLVVRKSLLTPKGDSGDDWLRTNVFHATCTIADKVYKLIIDSGSCENVVSEEAIEKLQLKMDCHPKPYKLSWLNKGSEVTVEKRCLVSFSIEKKYFDNAWCDVVSMDACHVLLGRPWQYDRSVIHDGQKNTYSLSIKRKRIVLVPRREGNIPAPVVNNPNLLSMSRFLVEVGHEKIVYALMPRENSTSNLDSEFPAEVQQLLMEFSDLMPEDLPPGLPPMRDIQHQIDLIPRSSLPNRPAYRLSPKEAEELQRQVVELLEKGYIRESMSHCAVPALLVPKKDGSWHMCVDSRAINRITVKYRFPIPRLDDMLD